MRIPLAKPEITEEDCNAVLEVLRTSQLSTGPKIIEFEHAICGYLNVPFAVAVNSGTSALHLALKILNIPEGSEVILPSFTFIAPLNALLQERLHPVFVDISPTGFNIDPEAVEAAITKQTKAIIAVHTFGRPANIEQLRAIADRHNLALIEDACEAIGAEFSGQKVGSFGDFGTLAFYPNKQITTGEGGVLLTHENAFAERARRLRNQGRDASLDWYQNVEPGYSYRLSDMNCAFGIEQLSRIESTIARRQFIAGIYRRKLKKFNEVMMPDVGIENGRISWFCYVIQFADAIDQSGRDRIAESLKRKGIGTGRYFAPLHRQPVLAPYGTPQSLPVTDHVADRVLALPFFNQMTEAEVDEVCAALAESLLELRRST